MKPKKKKQKPQSSTAVVKKPKVIPMGATGHSEGILLGAASSLHPKLTIEPQSPRNELPEMGTYAAPVAPEPSYEPAIDQIMAVKVDVEPIELEAEKVDVEPVDTPAEAELVILEMEAENFLVPIAPTCAAADQAVSFDPSAGLEDAVAVSAESHGAISSPAEPSAPTASTASASTASAAAVAAVSVGSATRIDHETEVETELARLLGDAGYTPDDVDVDADASRQSIKNAAKAVAEMVYRRKESELEASSVYGVSRGVIADLGIALDELYTNLEKGIAAADHEYLQAVISREQIKGQIVSSRLGPMATVISSVVGANTRSNIADADHVQEITTRQAAIDAQKAASDADITTRVSISNAGANTQAALDAARQRTQVDIARASNVTQANISNSNNKTRAAIATAGSATSVAVSNAGNRTNVSIANAGNKTRASVTNAGNSTSVSIADAGNATRVAIANSSGQTNVSIANSSQAAKVSLENARLNLQALITNANNESRANTTNANNESQAKITNANNESRAKITNANNESQALLTNANNDSRAKITNANNDNQVKMTNANNKTRCELQKAGDSARAMITDAQLLQAANIARLNAEIAVNSFYNSFQASVYSSKVSYERGKASIIASGVSRMTKPGLAWVEWT